MDRDRLIRLLNDLPIVAQKAPIFREILKAQASENFAGGFGDFIFSHRRRNDDDPLFSDWAHAAYADFDTGRYKFENDKNPTALIGFMGDHRFTRRSQFTTPQLGMAKVCMKAHRYWQEQEPNNALP
jgi:hypothetical protein